MGIYWIDILKKEIETLLKVNHFSLDFQVETCVCGPLHKFRPGKRDVCERKNYFDCA